MVKRRSPEQLAKIISYILGRNPAEFGLVPDLDGFVKIKEFLKAVWEEEGLKYVRKSNINEILTTLPDPPVEIRGNHIRAKYRQKLPELIFASNLPKLLYTCVRRKAYPIVLDKGIFPMGFGHVILSSEPEMAERMGKRKDPMPVLLIVQPQKSLDNGITFYEAGETLYLAASIPPECFTGPALPKQKEVPSKRVPPEEQALEKTPGSFLMKLKDTKAFDKTSKRKKKRKGADWGKEQKKSKKRGQKRERPPWRQ
jgi:putative RNA 2'-phosphotransferase